MNEGRKVRKGKKLLLPPEKYSQHTPESAMLALSNGFGCQEGEPLWGECHPFPWDETNLSSEESEILAPLLSSGTDLLNEVSDFISSSYLTLDNGAMADTQHTPPPLQPLPSATEYPECREGSSSAINVVGEGVVAGVNGIVPNLDDSLLLDIMKSIDGTDGSVEGPMSAKASQAYSTASDGETGVPASTDNTKTSCQSFISASGVPNGAPMSARSAKKGSQAFNYIGETAVLETHGITALPYVAPISQTSPGTFKPGGTAAAFKTKGSTLDLFNQAGTLNIDTKKVTVPGNATRYTVQPPNYSGTVPTKTTVLSEAMGDTLYLPIQPGTLKTDTVPHKTTAITMYHLNPSGTLEIDPTETTGITDYHVSLALDQELSTGPDGATESTNEGEESRNAKKRKRRRRKQAEEQQQKVPKYKQEPQEDAIAERKRRDAIRAKSGRDKNKKMMQELQEKLQEVEEERYRLQGANKRLAVEVKGRATWEMALLSYLRDNHGIQVAPYGTTSGCVGAPQQTSPAQPLLAALACPSR